MLYAICLHKKHIMKLHIQLSAAKNYFLGFVTSGAILFSGLLYFNGKGNEDAGSNTKFSEAEYVAAEKIQLKEFDPNSLTENEWKMLGFSERQTATILKYKNVVGGNFTSKQQLKKCYAISGEKFAELEPYILLPETSVSSYKNYESNYNRRNYYQNSSYKNHYVKKSLTVPGKFNPDHFSVTDFIKMGFTENQANSILKYKNYLGGSFISKEKFKECFIISDENYRKMEPYLLLPEKTPENYVKSKTNFQDSYAKTEKAKVNYQNFDPNMTDLEGWKNLGFSEKQAQVIINYRDRNLKGSFKSLEDIQRCFVISADKFEELKPYIVLNAETFKPAQNNSNPPHNNSSSKIYEAKTDFSKTDLNVITFKQLIEYGFDDKSAASFIGFRNKLGGFINKNQILDTYNIDKILAQRLVYIAPLNTENVQKYTLTDAPESWLKNHPYFKYYADKIIYYRISFTNEKKFFKTMNIKPEAEEKMKLYLK